MKKSKRLLIFDFDGTIVNSKQVYYHAINKHLNPLGFNKREVDKAIDLGMNIGETIKKFIPSKVSRWWIKRKIMKDVLKHVGEIKKCKDIDSLKKIKGRKILISNSLSEFVFPVLKHLKLTGCFKEIYCAEDFSDKTKFIKTYLKKNKIKPGNCFYVGDRVADVRVARKVKCQSIIILGKCAWDSRKEILASKPDFVVEDIKDIKKII